MKASQTMPEHGGADGQHRKVRIGGAAAQIKRAVHFDPPPDAVRAAQHQLGAGQHDEGDEEQDQAERDQRRQVKSPVASVNSLAMVAEIVVPGANSDRFD